MKYYSNFTNDYVQDICNALNNAEHKIWGQALIPQNFTNLTMFLRDIMSHASSFDLLDRQGLINKGRCPYTGQQVNSSSPNYQYYNKRIYMSSDGIKTMQRENDENNIELFGKPLPKKTTLPTPANKGCFFVLAILLVPISICVYLMI